jgi:hypothetical protein
MAPVEDSVDVEEISTDDGSELSVPSEQSSPTIPYSAGRGKDNAATSGQEYPDTGYPSTYNSREGTASFGESSRSADGPRSGKRGFYNDRYSDYAGTGSSQSNADQFTNDSSRASSSTLGDPSAGADSSYRDTIDRYRNAVNGTVDDTQDQMNHYVNQAQQAATAAQQTIQSFSENTLDSRSSSPDQIPSQTDLSQDTTSPYSPDISAHSDDSTRYASDQTDHGGSIDNGAATNDQFAPPSNAPNGSTDAEYNTPAGQGGDYSNDSAYPDSPATDAAAPDAGTAPSTQQPAAQPQRDPAKPWRPGSTSSYPLSSYSPQSLGSTGGSAVQPASYRQPSRPSDAGWQHHSDAPSTAPQYRTSGELPVRR